MNWPTIVLPENSGILAVQSDASNDLGMKDTNPPTIKLAIKLAQSEIRFIVTSQENTAFQAEI